MDDIYELMAYLLSTKYPDIDFEDMSESEIADYFHQHYNINEDDFSNLVYDLLPLCDKTKSELTGNTYSGFGINNMWLINIKLNNEHI